MSQARESEETIIHRVRERYGHIATDATGSGCGCASGGASETALRLGYDERQLATIPIEANLGLGCGAPVEHLQLKAGETVLDLGSGGGIDVFLAAREVGPHGRVIGVDMTPEMIERARAAAARGGFDRVEFRLGRLEELPVEDASIDAVTSNCVINLVPDKARVFAEVARVLRPGGRLAVSDIILEAPLPERVARDLLSYVGCVAGAMLRHDYFEALGRAGFEPPSILRDIDHIETLRSQAPADLDGLLERAEVAESELLGRVRSVTWRAVKR